MNRSDIERQIDEITWYHEFDFGNGLQTRSKGSDAANHRAIWRNIEDQLSKVDFAGKTVLDIGCWDGYWSFYAEKRGAKHVLATDDASQRFAGNRGLLLAKSLLSSSVEPRDVSIYDLRSLGRTFDIVLCLGVYYHLVDPIYAFAQVRHCCNEGTVVVFEGDGSMALPVDLMRYYLRDDRSLPIFVPSPDGLADILRACYFDVVSQVPWPPVSPPKWKKRLRLYRMALSRRTCALPEQMVRLTSVCKPVELENPLHPYKPPFGLHRYDPRFRDG